MVSVRLLNTANFRTLPSRSMLSKSPFLCSQLFKAAGWMLWAQSFGQVNWTGAPCPVCRTLGFRAGLAAVPS